MIESKGYNKTCFHMCVCGTFLRNFISDPDRDDRVMIKDLGKHQRIIEIQSEVSLVVIGVSVWISVPREL